MSRQYKDIWISEWVSGYQISGQHSARQIKSLLLFNSGRKESNELTGMKLIFCHNIQVCFQSFTVSLWQYNGKVVLASVGFG